MKNRIARIYVQGEACNAELLRKDKDTYIATLLIMRILTGKYRGDKIALFENGDKFQEWVP